MENKFKIFNIDFNKAGTTSLTKAMEILGFKSIHYKHDHKTIFDIVKKNEINKKELLNGISEYDFFSDFGGTNFYKELDRQYPGSKFILTVRETNSWLESLEKHVEKNKKNLIINRERLKNKKEQKILELKEYFKDRQDDFLIIDICGGDDWEKLCNFLSKPIPQVDFPCLNKAPISLISKIKFLCHYQ
jgi:hypothetical protein